MKRNFIRKKVTSPIMAFLKEGSSPEQLAIALALGIVVGVIPLLGTTTIICFLLAFALRLNMAALQLINYLIFPLQLLLFIPFFQAGSYFFEPQEISLSVGQISEMMGTNFFGTISQLWLANLQALIVWFLLAIPSYFVLYYILLHTLRKASAAWEEKAK